jgi:hypothetical protein
MYVEARIAFIALTSTLVPPVPVTVVDEPPGEGDEAGWVSVQPAAITRITTNINKQSGRERFMSGYISMIYVMCCD